MTLDDYRRYINAQLRLTGKTKCRWCGSKLRPGIAHFDHGEGWPVEGFDQPQWLYKKCPGRNCGYSWSVWKLGIARP